MISTIKQNLGSLYDPLFSNWNSNFQPDGPTHSHERTITYKFTAKVIQTTLFAGAAFKHLSNFAEFSKKMTSATGASGAYKHLLTTCGAYLALGHLFYLAYQIYSLAISGFQFYGNHSHEHKDICCRFELMDLLSSTCKTITSIALCMFGGFHGMAFAIGLEAAFLANAHFWHWQSRRFAQQSSSKPYNPAREDVSDVSNVYDNTKNFQYLDSDALSTKINGLASVPNSSKCLVDLRYSKINQALLCTLLQKLLPSPTSKCAIFLDLRGCNKISIDELSEIFQKWPQLHIKVGIPFSLEDIYSLQTWNPQVHIEYDTRFEEMAQLFEEGIDTDIIFQLGASQIKAHSFIFAAFKNAPSLPTTPISISGISEEDFKKLLKGIYLGMLSPEKHDVLKGLITQPSHLFEGNYSSDYLKTLFASAPNVPNGISIQTSNRIPVHVKERSYSLHPAILKARNPYFKTAIETLLNSTPTLDLTTLEDLGPALLQYTYTNTFPFTKITAEQFAALNLYIDSIDLRRLAELAYYQFLVKKRALSRSFDCFLSLVSATRFFHKKELPICAAKIDHQLRNKWKISLSSKKNGQDLNILTIHETSDLLPDIQELKGIKEIIVESELPYGSLKNLIVNQSSPPVLRVRCKMWNTHAEQYVSIAKFKEITLSIIDFQKKSDKRRLETFLQKQKYHLKKITFCSTTFKERDLKTLIKELDLNKTTIYMKNSVRVIQKQVIPLGSMNASDLENFKLI